MQSSPLSRFIWLSMALSVSAACGQSPSQTDAADATTDIAADISVRDSSDVAQLDRVVPSDTPTTDVAPPDTTSTDVVADDGPITPACPFAIAGALTLPSQQIVMTLTGGSHNMMTSCTPGVGSGGPEQTFSLHLAARTGVDLRTLASIDTVIEIRRACDDVNTAITCNNDADGHTMDAHVRTVLDPGDYFVLVDNVGLGTGGSYRLTFDTFTPASNSTCPTVMSVQDGVVVSGQDLATGGGSDTSCGPVITASTLFYSMNVPAGSTVRATATPTGTAVWSPVVVAMDQCSAATCLAISPGVRGSNPATVSYQNAGRADQTVIFAVSDVNGATAAQFNFVAAILQPAMNGSCAMAVPVTDRTELPTEDLTTAIEPNSACLPRVTGSVLYYSATIDPGQSLRIDAAAQGRGASFLPVIRILSACDATTCLAESDVSQQATASYALFTNTSARSMPLIIAVGSDTATDAGVVDLQFTIRDAPTNTTCDMATPVSDGTDLGGEDLSYAHDQIAACLPQSLGAVLYYSVTIPPGYLLTVGALGLQSSVTPVIRLLAACGTASCLSSTPTAGADTTTTMNYRNAGATDQPVVIAVGNNDASTGLFELTIALMAPN